MTNPMHLGQWLRFLAVPGADPCRRHHAVARAAMRALVTHARAAVVAKLADMARAPIVVVDDGITREVHVLDSIVYGFNRVDRTLHARLRETQGEWRDVPAGDPNSVILDPFLVMRGWRRRPRYLLQAVARDALANLTEQACQGLTADHEANVMDVREELLQCVWNGLQIAQRLRSAFATKVMRRQIRDALGIERDVMALARAARFETFHPAVTQQWMTFVWKHRVALERIRAQTPALLKVVAQHMFQHGVNPVVDPTQACREWLLAQGMSKRAYRLLAARSARPFREVISRFRAADTLPALMLATWLADFGSAQGPPRPMFYRVTFDQFGPGAKIDTARERLGKVPRPVFLAAAQRFHDVADGDAAQELAPAYRAIVDWWVESTPPRVLAQAGWERWRALARAEDARRRAAAAAASWPCALAGLRTPTAEVLALGTPLALFEEGRALRHCIYAYVDRCHEDHIRLFSARMRHQGRIERATIGLRQGPRGWRIWDIRAPCNRRMGGHWIPLARQLAETYTQQDGSTQLPLPIRCSLDPSRAGG